MQVCNSPGAAVEDSLRKLDVKARIECDCLDVPTDVITEEDDLVVLLWEGRASIRRNSGSRTIGRQVTIGIGGVDIPTAEAIAFKEVPSVITAWLDGIHFLPVARSCVLNHRLPIWQERKAEGVAQAVGIECWNRARDFQVRIVAGDGPIKVEAKHLSIDVSQGLPIGNGRDVVSNRPP